MKRFYLLVAAASIVGSTSAASVSLDMIQTGWKNTTDLSVLPAQKPVAKWQTHATRSVDEPKTDFTATNAEFYYMGDVLGNGTGVYQLYLSNMAMDKGMPVETGQMARFELIGEPTDADSPELCTGTFNVLAELTEVPEAGVVVGADSDVLDVFPYPDDPDQGLVAYSFIPVAGTLTIEANGDGYAIDFEMDGELRDSETEEVISSQKCKASYNGPCNYVDIYAYTPLAEDIDLPELKASGRYTDGNYSIAFYTDGLIDEEGWVVGAGYLLNAEIFVEPVAPMNVDNLIGTFGPNDVFTDGVVPGTFGEGVWYPIYGNLYAAMLTSITAYDKTGTSGAIGLAKEGTITGSKEGNNFKILFDLTTAEGKKITGQYVGDIAADITDFSEPVSVDSISAMQEVKGGKGCIEAPANARIYNLSGVETSARNLPAGIYLVSLEGKTVKVIVK